MNNTIPYLLTAYGLPHTMGYIPTQAGERHQNPWSTSNLLAHAKMLGLAGIELPLGQSIPSFDGQTVETKSSPIELSEQIRAEEMSLVADYGALLEQDAEHLKEYLLLAAKCGVTVVRACLSHILCGDRRGFPGGWDAHIEALGKRLNEVLPFAEAARITISVENHQDASTDDLLRLVEMVNSHPCFGITLDTGNPLAVGEDPVEAAQRLAPFIRHLHLKDYTIHFAPNGYRLVRCAAGEGVVDFPAILNAVRAVGYSGSPGIEIAAQSTRTIPCLEPTWWDEYPPRQAKEFTKALIVLWDNGRSMDESYGSAWEHGGNSEDISREELEVVDRSVNYFRRIHPQLKKLVE